LTSALYAGEDLNSINCVRHSRITRRTPGPSLCSYVRREGLNRAYLLWSAGFGLPNGRRDYGRLQQSVRRIKKLRDKFKFTEDEIAEVRSHLLADCEIVSPVDVPSTACRDPNNLPVLGTAVAGRADILITVDKGLLDLREYSGISIIRPGQFWRRVDTETVPPGPTDDQQS